jgi:hypothetical protein
VVTELLCGAEHSGTPRRPVTQLLITLFAVTLLAACGDSGNGGSTSSTSWVRKWNAIAIDASGLDHTPVAPGETRIFGEHLGPGRSSRAMAIVHVAIFEAVNAIAGGYGSYTNLPPVTADTSMSPVHLASRHLRRAPGGRSSPHRGRHRKG